MSQKSVTTTTSFIISSDESLNKPPLSSSQSTDSSDNMPAIDSIQNNIQYSVSLNPVNNTKTMVQSGTSHQHELHNVPMSQSAQQPTYSPQGPLYGQSPTGFPLNYVPCTTTNNTTTISNNNNQQQLGAGVIQCNSDSTPIIYGIYDSRNNLQSNTKLSADIASSNSINVNAKQFNQTQPIYCMNADSRVPNGLTSNNCPTDEKNSNSNLDQYNYSAYQHQIKNGVYQQKSNPSVQTFHRSELALNGQRKSISSLESSASNSLMPINVKGMLLHGVASDEVMKNWLASIKCEDYLKNFIDNGYDMRLLTRMTPQDLTAIGCKSPAVRKKLLIEIKKLNLDDDIPECRPHSLEHWFELLKLSGYYRRICDEGYSTIDKVCELTWEDLEEIGVHKLGHQKRLLLGIERVKKFDKQQDERKNDHAIYDVHPNHRMSLNQNSSDPNRLSTLGRSTVRSGFFQTRLGANLDYRGLPVATVMPALKHVNSSLANLDISHQIISKPESPSGFSTNGSCNTTSGQITIDESNRMQPLYQTSNQELTMTNMSDSTMTMKRNPPPLPPVRTNSLKIPNDPVSSQNNNNIYGNSYTIQSNNGTNHVPLTTGSTTFLRTPKLGTLTATTNKMLTLGGHIQLVNGQPATVRSLVPIRDAPLPPIPLQPPTIPEKIEEESSITMHNFNIVGGTSLMNSANIGHQLASADEFPPPPPSQ